MLVAIAAINAITGLAALAILVPLTFGGDVDIYRRGAEGIAQGVIAQDFLYAPLAGLLATPLTWVPFTAAALAMSALGATMLAVGAWLESRGLPTVDRMLIGIAAFGFIPVVYDLVIGQVTILIAATIYPLRDRDGVLRGVPFGIALALVPKPLMIPLLIWMLLWRRQALLGAAAAAGVMTLAGVVVLGPAIYEAWIGALRGAGEVSRNGNFSVWTGGGSPLPLALGAATIFATAAALRAPRGGFIATLAAGVMLAPYSLVYALAILVLAVRPALEIAPRLTRVIAMVANLAVIAVPLAWAASWLLVPWERERRHTAGHDA